MRTRKVLSALRRCATTVTVPAVVVVGLAPPAVAEDAPAKTLQIRRVDSAALQALSKTAAEAGKSSPRTKAKIDDYLTNEARLGRLLDRSDVMAATVASPFGGEITLVWDGAQAPDRVDLSKVTTEQGTTQLGFGVGFTETASSAGGRPVTAGGFGFDPGTNPSNMYNYTARIGAQPCRSVYFDPNYPHSTSHFTRTCYEKWAQPGTRNWIYNRWALWTRGAPSGAIRAETVDFTIRARPWAGQEYKVSFIGDHTPNVGSAQCWDVATLGLSLGGASLNIPVHRCNSTTVLPNDQKKSMGIDWNGRTESQLYLDAAVEVVAADSRVVPVYADYTWAEVNSCGYIPGIPCSPATPTQYLVTKDAGWYWP